MKYIQIIKEDADEAKFTDKLQETKMEANAAN